VLYSSRYRGAVAEVSALPLVAPTRRTTTELEGRKASGSGLGVTEGEAFTDRDGVGEGVPVADTDKEGAGVDDGVGEADGAGRAIGAGATPRKVKLPAVTFVVTMEPALAAFASAE
jgi:hypothetical protein